MKKVKEFTQRPGRATPLPIFYLTIAFMSEVSKKLEIE